MSVDETIDLLLENPKSFCRYGDGEVLYMRGRGLPFQEYNKDLDLRLREILQSSSDKCHIGIDGRYFDVPQKNISQKDVTWIRQWGFYIRQELLKYGNRKRLYIQATITCHYMSTLLPIYEYQIFYEKIKRLFKDRDLVIFSGKTVFDKINYNVFEYAKSRRHIFAESYHAYRQYKEILDAARKFPKNEVTLCFILGPTATVAAWDLAQEGYMAWDIGHIAKDYDFFIKKLDQTRGDFFNPD